MNKEKINTSLSARIRRRNKQGFTKSNRVMSKRYFDNHQKL